MNTYVLELSKALAKKGYEIDVYTRSVDKNSPKIVTVSPGLRIIHLVAGEQADIPKEKLLDFIPEFLKSFYAFTEKEHLTYNLVSAHYYLSGVIGLDIKKKTKAGLFVTFHTLGIMKNLVARSDEEEEQSAQRITIELQLTAGADKVIATSKSDAQYIETLYNCPKQKIAIISPGVNLDLFRPIDKNEAKRYINADASDKLILFVGRVDPLKGVDMLIYAVKILLERQPALKICLWIVGGNVSKDMEKWSEELQELEKIREILHVGASVHFAGQKDREELPYYYNASEIVVLPSQYESFGITALEAMACGTPVITTDVAGVSQLFDKKHAALITSSNNPILLATKIQNLLSNDQERESISREFLQKAQGFSWESVASAFITIITCAE